MSSCFIFGCAIDIAEGHILHPCVSVERRVQYLMDYETDWYEMWKHLYYYCSPKSWKPPRPLLSDKAIREHQQFEARRNRELLESEAYARLSDDYLFEDGRMVY